MNATTIDDLLDDPSVPTTATTLDELTSRIMLHLDLQGAEICEMTADVFDMLSDYPIEEVSIRGWHRSPMKLLELVWDHIAWPDGGSRCRFKVCQPGLRILLVGPDGDDDPEGPVFCDICIHARSPQPVRRVHILSPDED
jgi:hypothetical protein